MNRTFHLKVMTCIISGLLVCLTVFWAQAQAQKKATPKPTPTPTPEGKIQIEETIERRVGENQIVFKPEFEVVRQSNDVGVVRRRATGTNSEARRVIVGEISCNCKKIPGTNGGGCRYTIENTTVTCTAIDGCTCKIVVVTKSTQ